MFSLVDPDVRLYVVSLPITVESKKCESDLRGSCWGRLDRSPFGDEDALCPFCCELPGAQCDAVQGQRLQTGDLSDITSRPGGSVTLQGMAWLPALSPGVELTNKIPE